MLDSIFIRNSEPLLLRSTHVVKAIVAERDPHLVKLRELRAELQSSVDASKAGTCEWEPIGLRWVRNQG